MYAGTSRNYDAYNNDDDDADPWEGKRPEDNGWFDMNYLVILHENT